MASHAGRKRSARTGRRVLVAAGAALMVLPLGVGSASAQSFLDPNDPCLGEAPPASFSDRNAIPAVHRRNVDCAAAEGITLGVTATRFAPAGVVSRGQMASFIIRTLKAGGHEIPAPSDQGFRDIARDEHRDAINQLAALGITKGLTADTYGPGLPVRRDWMASFLVRAAEFAYEGDTLGGNTVGTFPFTDVPADNEHRQNIAAAVELLGLTEGVTSDRFQPAAPTTRAQMATFVIRLLDVTLIPEP